MVGTANKKKRKDLDGNPALGQNREAGALAEQSWSIALMYIKLH
jgi:hypothetical protein